MDVSAIDIPPQWALYAYIVMEAVKFLYGKFVSQQEYMKILRDISVSQHATAQILKGIAERLEGKENRIWEDFSGH